MKKLTVIIFFLSFLNADSQNISTEFRAIFSGEGEIVYKNATNLNNTSVFDIKTGIDVEACVLFKTIKSYNINTGLNYSNLVRNDNESFKNVSGILKEKEIFLLGFFKSKILK